MNKRRSRRRRYPFRRERGRSTPDRSPTVVCEGAGVLSFLAIESTVLRKRERRLRGDPIPCGPDPRPASHWKWCAVFRVFLISRLWLIPGRGGRSWLSRAHVAFACAPVLLPFRSSRKVFDQFLKRCGSDRLCISMTIQRFGDR